MNNLGVLLQMGRGVEKSLERKQSSGYAQAAEEGESKAQANLGLMSGIAAGVKQDLVQAYKWFILSAGTTGCGRQTLLHRVTLQPGHNERDGSSRANGDRVPRATQTREDRKVRAVRIVQPGMTGAKRLQAGQIPRPQPESLLQYRVPRLSNARREAQIVRWVI